MARGLLVLLLAGALGAGVFHMLDPGGDDGGSMEDYSAAGDGSDDENAPALEGSGTELIDEPEALEREPIELSGRVVDEEGQPLAGIEVAAYWQTPDWSDQSKEALAHRQPDASLRRRIEAIRTPPASSPEPTATATSDAGGNFAVLARRPGNYKLRALVESPLYSTYSSIGTNRRWAPVPIVIHVLSGKALRGRVVGEGDRPIAAQITADNAGTAVMYGYGNDPKLWESAPVTSEPEEGRFEIAAAPTGKLRFTVRTPDGRTFAGLRADWDGSEDVVLRIPQGTSRITGRVHTADDKPIVDADLLVRVSATGPGQPSISVAGRTGADGTYDMENLPAGDVVGLEAGAPGYATISQQSARLAPWWGLALEPGKAATLNVLLLRGGSVRGTITSAAGDLALEGAKVRLMLTAAQSGLASPQPQETVTDSEGHYAFVGVPAGAYRLSIKHKTHYLKPENGTVTVRDLVSMDNMRGQGMPMSPETTVVMPMNGGTLERDLVMTPGIALSGTVQGPSDEPIEGATIHLQGSNQHNQDRKQTALATSDAEGHFTIQNMAPGENWRFYAHKSGFAAEQADPLEITEEDPPEALTLRLVLGASISGRVQSDTGEGVPGATVNCWGQLAELAGSQTWARVDDDGVFTIKDLPPGSWQLWAWAPGRQNQSQTNIKDLKAGEERTGIEIELKGTAETGSVSGRVIDQFGKGVSGMTLMIQGKKTKATMHTSTGNDGRFQLAMAGLTGEITITVMGKSRKAETFDAGDDDIEIVIERPKQVTLRGTVHDLKGLPVPLCSVRLGKGSRNTNRNMGLMEATVVSPGMMPGGAASNTVNGVFSLTVSGDGPWQVTASNAKDRSGRPLNLKSTTIDVANADIEVKLQMDKGEMVSGIVVGPDQQPLEGATVAANGSSHRTKADGLFTIPGASGTLTVNVTPPKGFVRPAAIKAEPGQELRIELESGLEIGGRVRMPEGTTMGAGRISMSWPASPGTPRGSANATIKPDGTFLATGIPPRVKVTVTVSIWQSSITVAPISLKDVEPGTTDLDIQVEEGSSIKGTILEADGAPRKSGYLQASPVDPKLGGSSMGAQISADGTFELKGLKPGRYKLMTWGPGGQSQLGEATAPSEGIELRAQAQAVIKGTLVGSDVQGFMVRAVREDDPEGKTGKFGQVGGDGAFSVTVPDGDHNWFLAFTKVGDDRYGLSEGVAVGTTDVRVGLRKGESISGRVEDAEGKPVKGVFVMINGAIYAYGRTNDKGEFEIMGLPSGSYELRVNGRGSNKAIEKVDTGTRDLLITL